MKKKWMIAVALLMVAGATQAVSAAGTTTTGTGMTWTTATDTIPVVGAVMAGATSTAGSTTVGVNVDPSYTVTIPANTKVEFNETDAVYGTIRVETAQLDRDKCIKVTLNSDRKLKDKDDPDKVIPYEILSQENPFTAAYYTEAGEETPLTIAIKKENWNKAYAGTYADTVTFTVSYVSLDEAR